MKQQRRILEVLIVLAVIAGVVFFLKPAGNAATPTPAEASLTPRSVPYFTAGGVGLGMTEEQVVHLLGASKGDRFNKNRERYLNFGETDLMFKGGKVSVITTRRVDFGQDKFVATGQARSTIQAQLGEPFVPGPEPGPHRAPDYEFYRGRDCLLEVTYKGDLVMLLTVFQDHH